MDEFAHQAITLQKYSQEEEEKEDDECSLFIHCR